MSYPSLPPEDLPPDEATLGDRLIRRQLEDCLNHYFYAACISQVHQSDRPPRHGKSRSLLGLLSRCKWYVTTTDTTLLAIDCPDLATCWRVLENLEPIAQLLDRLAVRKIRIAPPPNCGTPLEVRIDELSVYRDPSKQ